MYEGYTSAVKQVMPQAQIVVDRFHVAKAYRDGVDKLRKEVQRELKDCLTKEEYAGLKGTIWLFRRAPQDLTKAERARLALLFECAPDLKQAYDLREQLTAIFETDHNKASATTAIKRWVKRVTASGLSCFDSFLVTLENWLDEITNYFVHRLTSGFVEGFNNKAKVLKRRCYGITNLTHFFQRLYLDLEGYRLFGALNHKMLRLTTQVPKEPQKFLLSETGKVSDSRNLWVSDSRNLFLIVETCFDSRNLFLIVETCF
jgi:transposase